MLLQMKRNADEKERTPTTYDPNDQISETTPESFVDFIPTAQTAAVSSNLK